MCRVIPCSMNAFMIAFYSGYRFVNYKEVVDHWHAVLEGGVGDLHFDLHLAEASYSIYFFIVNTHRFRFGSDELLLRWLLAFAAASTHYAL